MGALQLKDIANHAAAGLAVAGLTSGPMTVTAHAQQPVRNSSSYEFSRDSRRAAMEHTATNYEDVAVAIRLGRNNAPDKKIDDLVRDIYDSRDIKVEDLKIIYESTNLKNTTYSLSYAGIISEAYFVGEVGPKLVKHADFVSKDRTAVEDLKQILD